MQRLPLNVQVGNVPLVKRVDAVKLIKGKCFLQKGEVVLMLEITSIN